MSDQRKVVAPDMKAARHMTALNYRLILPLQVPFLPQLKIADSHAEFPLDVCSDL